MSDEEGHGELVPEKADPIGLHRRWSDAVESFDSQSDSELIAAIHLSGTANRSGQEFELQRRFVEQITTAMGGASKAAWALVVVTSVLAVATIGLVIATFILATTGG